MAAPASMACAAVPRACLARRMAVLCGGGHHLQRLSAERCSRALGPERAPVWSAGRRIFRRCEASPRLHSGSRGLLSAPDARGAPPTSPGTVTDAVAATDKGRHKGDYSDDVQAGERRQRFFLADGFFAAGFLALDFFLGGSLGSASPSAGATTVLMTPKR